MKLAVFADCHANLGALEACACHLASLALPDVQIVLLGDYVDYGPRPNEVVAFLQAMKPLVVLRGNHEKAVYGGEEDRFSSSRGIASVEWTRAQLNTATWDFLNCHDQGFLELADEAERRMLFIHGDRSDPFWGKMTDEEMRSEQYRDYDFVFSGHSHVPHYREVFYRAEDPARRNKKKTIFLNPGSVGQPRNLCPAAQYLTIDTATEVVTFHKVPYGIEAEQALYGPGLDDFYRARLEFGI